VGLIAPRVLRLYLPRVIVAQLGLRVERSVFTRRTPEGVQQLDRVCGVGLTLLGRTGWFNAVVEPFADYAVIGRMVLTDLDLLYDNVAGTLIPRDPNTVITEIG